MGSVVGSSSRGGRALRAGRIRGAAGPGGRPAAAALAACAVPLLVCAVPALACPTPAHARAAGDTVPAPRPHGTRHTAAHGPVSYTTVAHQVLSGGAPAPAAGGAPAPAPNSPATDDFYAVFCLAPEHRAQTAAAAVRLGVARAVPGHEDRVALSNGAHAKVLDVPAWAAARPADFHRTCAAVVAAAQLAPAAAGDTQGGGSDGLVQNGLAAAIGAFLTLIGQFVERGTARLRQRSDELGTARAGFAQQAEVFLHDWGAERTSSFEGVRSARAALAALLRSLPSHGARRAAAARLADALPLAEEPETTTSDGIMGMRALIPEERAAEVARLHASLTSRLGEVEELTGLAGLWYLRHAVRAAGARLPRRSSAGGAP